MSRELENQIKRANNMLKYYNEKLKNDQSKRKFEFRFFTKI